MWKCNNSRSNNHNIILGHKHRKCDFPKLFPYTSWRPLLHCKTFSSKRLSFHQYEGSSFILKDSHPYKKILIRKKKIIIRMRRFSSVWKDSHPYEKIPINIGGFLPNCFMTSLFMASVGSLVSPVVGLDFRHKRFIAEYNFQHLGRGCTLNLSRRYRRIVT